MLIDHLLGIIHTWTPNLQVSAVVINVLSTHCNSGMSVCVNGKQVVFVWVGATSKTDRVRDWLKYRVYLCVNAFHL